MTADCVGRRVSAVPRRSRQHPGRAVYALALAATWAVLGCGAGADGRSGTVIRDSAGIVIVENGPDGAWPEDEAWRLSAAPILEIGVFEGEDVYQLHGVVQAARLSDGRLVVANAGTHELRFYDADGRHLRSVGGEGGGPGEFRGIRALDRAAGDTILAWDWDAVRLSVFAPDGEFVRSVSPTVVDEGFRPQFYGAFAGGSFVIRPRIIPSDLLRAGDGLRRDTAAYARYDGRDGAPLDTVAVTPGRERVVRVGEGDRFSLWDPLFGRGPHFDVHGRRAYVGVSDRYEVRVYTPDAGLQRVIRRVGDPVPVTEADVDRYVEDRALDALDPGEREDPAAMRQLKEAFRDRHRAETFPAFDAVLADDVGNLWVREHDRPGAEGPRRWSVFDADGRLLGTVETPRGLKVFQIGRDFVLGRARDELDIELVRLYTLTKPNA